MLITSLPAPVLMVGLILTVALVALLILITACSPAAARRLVRLLEALQRLLYGTYPNCGRGHDSRDGKSVSRRSRSGRRS